MEPSLARQRFTGESVVRFGMFGPDGRPHVVPVIATVIDDKDDGVVVFAVDGSGGFASIGPFLSAGVRAHPRVTLLADRALVDGSTLWWVQAQAVAEILRSEDAEDPRFDVAIAALESRHAHVALRPVPPLVVWNTVTGWMGQHLESS